MNKRFWSSVSFSFIFVISLFFETSWDGVVCSVTIGATMIACRFSFVIRITGLCRHKLIWLLWIKSLCLKLFCNIIDFKSSKVKPCIRIFIIGYVFNSNEFYQCMKRYRRFITVDVCFSFLLSAKFVRFFCKYFKFIVRAFSLHQHLPFICWTFSAKWRTVSLSFSTSVRAPTWA